MRNEGFEHDVFALTMMIFNQENSKLLDKNKLTEWQTELYDKSLVTGIGAAVAFVLEKGDSLSFSERQGLSQGNIPNLYAERGLGCLHASYPQLHKNEEDFNFCSCWFYAGIGVAVAFMQRMLLEQSELPEVCAGSAELSIDAILPYNQFGQSKEQNDEGNYLIDFVAAELKRDLKHLSELGIKLDKGQLAAKTGGVAWAGYEAFTGDWLSALVVGGISLLVGGLTNSYKRIKIMEIQERWKERLSELNSEQLKYLAEGLERKYPLVLRRFQNLLQAGE
jgi:hypothetical protein